MPYFPSLFLNLTDVARCPCCQAKSGEHQASILTKLTKKFTTASIVSVLAASTTRGVFAWGPKVMKKWANLGAHLARGIICKQFFCPSREGPRHELGPVEWLQIMKKLD